MWFNAHCCGKHSDEQPKEVAVSKLSVSLKSATLATVAALTVATFAMTSAFAATPGPAAEAVPTSTVLASDLKAEKAMLSYDSVVLDRVEEMLDRVDIGAIRVVPAKRLTLGDYNMILSKAESLAKNPAGFDASGNVTDAAQATKTVQTIGRYLDQLRNEFGYGIRHILGVGQRSY
jgi:hypothetical protein